MFDLTQWGQDLLKTLTERDKQTRVGASDLSNTCTRCVADALLALKRDVDESPFWLSPRLGTGLHLLIEQRAPEHGALPEHKLILGELPGYGIVKSTADLYINAQRMVVDAKSTKRVKLKDYKRVIEEDDKAESLIPARNTISTYLNQIMLYGRGYELEGLPVDSVGILFVCRDGSGDNDVWGWSVPYSREHADKVWNRAVRLWAWLEEGGDVDDLNKAPGCWVCTNLRSSKNKGKLYLNLEEGGL